jgi:hypothetical protein
MFALSTLMALPPSSLATPSLRSVRQPITSKRYLVSGLSFPAVDFFDGLSGHVFPTVVGTDNSRLLPPRACETRRAGHSRARDVPLPICKPARTGVGIRLPRIRTVPARNGGVAIFEEA